MSGCTCTHTDGYRIKRRGCPAHTKTDADYWQQYDDRKYGTDSPHEPTADFIRAAFTQGARQLWPDSRDPGWEVTFDRWLTARLSEIERLHHGQPNETCIDADRRAERAEAVLDGWEHDGPDGYEFHLLIRRVREALDGDAGHCRRCGCEVDGDGKCPCGCDEPNRTQIPASVHGLCHTEAGCDEPNECGHEWLDRPESDTRECLICGVEVAG